MLLRGDVRHGGAAYEYEHVRLHEYWEPIDPKSKSIAFREKHDADDGDNDLHALETDATWNADNAKHNPRRIYCGDVFAYDAVVAAAAAPGLEV